MIHCCVINPCWSSAHQFRWVTLDLDGAKAGLHRGNLVVTANQSASNCHMIGVSRALRTLVEGLIGPRTVVMLSYLQFETTL